MSEILLDTNFSDLEKTYILFEVIKKNIACGHIDLEEVCDIDKFRNYPFEKVTREQLDTFFKITDDFSDVTMPDSTEEQDKEWELAIKKCTVRSDSSFYHGDIKRYYFDKIYNFDEEDIKRIIEALRGLYINEQVLLSVEKVLKAGELNNKNTNQSIENNLETPLFEKKARNYQYTPSVTKVNPTFRWIKGCINVRKLLPIRPLSIIETICVSVWLLNEGYERKDIENSFFNNLLKNSLEEDNTLLTVAYVELRPKLSYCVENNISKLLNKDLLQELDDWVVEQIQKSEIEQVKGSVLSQKLSKLMGYMPNLVLENYSYELSCAQKVRAGGINILDMMDEIRQTTDLISKVVDLSNLHPKIILSLKERVDIVAYMLSLNYPEVFINIFLDKCYKLDEENNIMLKRFTDQDNEEGKVIAGFIEEESPKFKDTYDDIKTWIDIFSGMGPDDTDYKDFYQAYITSAKDVLNKFIFSKANQKLEKVNIGKKRIK